MSLALLVVPILLVGVGAAEDRAKEAVEAHKDLSHLADLVESGLIENIEIFHVHNDVATGIPISPEQLKRIYTYKLEVKPDGFGRLAETLRKTSTNPLPLAGNGIDVRTVVVVHTAQHTSVQISLTGPGIWAVVNGHPAQLSPALSAYLGTLFGSKSW